MYRDTEKEVVSHKVDTVCCRAFYMLDVSVITTFTQVCTVWGGSCLATLAGCCVAPPPQSQQNLS